MTKTSRILEQMRSNPRDWRMDQLKTVADARGLDSRQPGGSHVVFRHPRGAMLSVPARRPIKPVYVRKFVRLVEAGVAE